MVAAVTKTFAGFQTWKLSDYTVALDYDTIAVLFGYHPFSAANRHGNIRVVADADMVDEWEGAVLGSVEMRTIDYFVYGHIQSFELGNHRRMISHKSRNKHRQKGRGSVCCLWCIRVLSKNT
jgi:hypothetical protein